MRDKKQRRFIFSLHLLLVQGEPGCVPTAPFWSENAIAAAPMLFVDTDR